MIIEKLSHYFKLQTRTLVSGFCRLNPRTNLPTSLSYSDYLITRKTSHHINIPPILNTRDLWRWTPENQRVLLHFWPSDTLIIIFSLNSLHPLIAFKRDDLNKKRYIELFININPRYQIYSLESKNHTYFYSSKSIIYIFFLYNSRLNILLF